MATNTFYIKPIALWNIDHKQSSCAGNREEIEYVPEMTDEGYKLKETGKKIDVQAQIQAYADECDLTTLIKGLLENGLDVTHGVKYTDEVIDVTELQNSTIHEQQKAQAEYEKNLAYYKQQLEEAQAKLKAQENQGGNENGE